MTTAPEWETPAPRAIQPGEYGSPFVPNTDRYADDDNDESAELDLLGE